MFAMRDNRLQWGQPQTCGWCAQITSAGTTCVHCQRPLALAWGAPVVRLGQALARLARAAVLVVLAVLGLALLFQLSPIIVMLPVIATLVGSNSLAARSANRPHQET